MLNCVIWLFNGKVLGVSLSGANKNMWRSLKTVLCFLFFLCPSACIQKWHNLAYVTSLCHHGNACDDVAKYLSNSISYGALNYKQRFC